jgi:hypothetical protein
MSLSTHENLLNLKSRGDILLHKSKGLHCTCQSPDMGQNTGPRQCRASIMHVKRKNLIGDSINTPSVFQLEAFLQK